MAKWLLVVETNCADAQHEAEFNEWYDKIHLPHVLETPGFVRATRYENTEPTEGMGKFLAIYEIETNDLDQAMKALEVSMDKERAKGQSGKLGALVSRGVYRQLSCLSQSDVNLPSR